jgi:hypothetical protein
METDSRFFDHVQRNKEHHHENADSRHPDPENLDLSKDIIGFFNIFST